MFYIRGFDKLTNPMLRKTSSSLFVSKSWTENRKIKRCQEKEYNTYAEDKGYPHPYQVTSHITISRLKRRMTTVKTFYKHQKNICTYIKP